MEDEQGFLDDKVEEQNEIAEHLLGIVARRNGKPMDRTKSFAWQRGWAEGRHAHDASEPGRWQRPQQWTGDAE